MQRVAVLLYDGMRCVDYGLIAEVWAGGRTEPAGSELRLMFCSPRRRHVAADHGVRISATHPAAAAACAELIIVPGTTRPDERVPHALLDVLRRAHAAGTPVAGLHTGALALAEAGLLDGRRATIHPRFIGRLRALCPQARIESALGFVVDGGVGTSASSDVWTDLCWQLVREAYGAQTAAIFDRLICSHRRYDVRQAAGEPLCPLTSDNAVLETIAWIRTHLTEHLSVPKLAERAHMSERTFVRRFAEITGTTPLTWMNRERVRLAQRLLQDRRIPVDVVAQRCGFGTPLTLRRHFRDLTGMTPSAYRAAYRHGAADATAGERWPGDAVDDFW